MKQTLRREPRLLSVPRKNLFGDPHQRDHPQGVRLRGAEAFRISSNGRVVLLLPCLLLVLLLVAACGGATSTNAATNTGTGTTSVTTPTLAPTTPTTTSGAATTSTSTASKGPRKQSAATISARENELIQSLGPYAPAFKNQLAQGLHLTTTQLMQKMQAGQTLTGIASAQGLSSTQLSTLLASALSASLMPAVQAGKLTQQQLGRLTQRLQKNPDQLDTLLSK